MDNGMNLINIYQKECRNLEINYYSTQITNPEMISTCRD